MEKSSISLLRIIPVRLSEEFSGDPIFLRRCTDFVNYGKGEESEVSIKHTSLRNHNS